MKDEVIRIILEAKDRLSKTVRNAEKNVNQSLGNMQKDLKKTDKEFDKFGKDLDRSVTKSDKSMKRWSDSVRGHVRSIQSTLSGARQEFEKTNIAFGKVERDARGRFQKIQRDEVKFLNEIKESFHGQQSIISGNDKSLVGLIKRLKQLRSESSKPINFGKTFQDSAGVIRSSAERDAALRENRIHDFQARQEAIREGIRQHPVTRAVSAFQEGRQQTKQLAEELKLFVAGSEEELKKRKIALREESVERREILRNFADTQREILREDQETKARELEKEIRGQKVAAAEAQDLLDERIAKRARRRKLAFDKEEYQRTTQLNKELRAKARSTDREIYKREEERRKLLREIQDSPLDARTKENETAAVKQRFKEEIRRLRDARDEDATARKEANIQINRENASDRDASLQKLEDFNASQRKKNSKAVIEDIALQRAAAAEISAKQRSELSSALRRAGVDLERSIRNKAAGLTGKGEADLVQQFLEARSAKQAAQSQDVLSRSFRSAGNAFGDFTRGLKRGRNELSQADKLAKRMDTTFARLGQTIGQFTKNIGNLVNLRWYILISAIQLLGQLVVVLGANLISLASSAALAASALGAGLAAAVAQAIPVVGLLYAAFSRVGAAFKAAQQASKAGATSSQDARAQAEAQTAAQQRLSDALYSQVQAVKSLAAARKQAGRDIVDSINAEIDANFALKDAEFAVLDAKQQLRDLEKQNQQDQQSLKDAEAAVKEAKERLAAAKKQGDAAEIEKAQEQLALAQQNLQDVKGQASKSNKRQIDEQKLAVKEAEQQVKEAKIAQQRQREDTAKTVRLGVKGNQSVVDALHGVATANREVADAQRGVTDAQNKQLSSGNILQRQLSQLDPAERALYKTFRAIQKSFKETFRPITDIIVNAVTGAVKRVGKVLQNPEIINGFKGLARVIGKGIGDLAKFFTSKGFLHDFAGFIHAATSNIPTLIKIIKNLTGAFVGLAKAGQPIVKDLLGRFAGVTGSLSSAINAPAGGTTHGGHGQGIRTSQQTKGQEFIAKAKNYLDSWIKLADSIGRVFKYLFLDAAPSGNNLVGSLTRMFNNLANFLRDNPQKVKKFFDGMVTSLQQIASALFPVVKVLLNAFTGSNAAAFTQFTAQVVIPGLALMLQFTTELTKVLLIASKIPGIKFFLQLLVAEKALNRVFPATQKVTDAVKKMGGWFFKAGTDGSKGFTKLWRAMKFTAFQIKYYSVLARDRILAIGGGAKNAAEAVGKWMKKMVVYVIDGSKKMIAWLWRTAVAFKTTLVNAIKDAAKALYELVATGFKAVVTFITETLIPALYRMGAAMYVALGPWGLLAIAIVAIGVLIYKFRKQVLAALEYVWNWIKDHWKLLAVILFGPFALVIIAIVKWRKKILGFFEDIFNWIKNPSNWGMLAHWLAYPFEKFYNFMKSLPSKILSIFKKIWKDIKNIFGDVAHWLTSNLTPHLHIHHWHGIPYPSITFGKEPDLVKNEGGDKEQAPTYVPPHDGKKGKIINKDGRPVMDTGGRVPGHDGQAVPIIAHAGEWILNKSQQMKLAHKLNDTTGQVKNFLFGSGKKGGETGHHGKNRQLAAHEKGKGTKTRKGNHAFPYDLVSQQDDFGNTVWFIEALTGQFLELSGSDAAHMIRTGGKWIPKWIKNHGFKLRKVGQAIEGMQHYMAGGIVKPEMSYAMGGVVNSPNSNYDTQAISNVGGNVHHKKVEQNFNVKTEGETDWNYVMRLAAMHAQGSF